MNNRHLRIAVSCILAGGIIACASGAKTGTEGYGRLGAPADKVPFMESALTGTLSNGLRYVILENAKPENRAYLTLAVNAGSVLEDKDQQGLAHFVEHMAFNGTERFPESELVNYLRSLGMRFGADVNAYTSYDETVYSIEVPTEADETGLKRIPDTALAVLDDWTHRLTFDPKEVEDERLVIMEEYRSRLGAMDRVRRQMLPTLFGGSRYADRRPIGLPEIIETAPPAKLAEFYQRWYRADNMALIFVGDFDGPALEASLTAHFSMPTPDSPLKRPKYDLPPPKKGLTPKIFTDPELTFTRVELYYKRPLKPITGDLAEYREAVVEYLINTMLSYRFDEAASKPETPYLNAGGGTIRYGASSRYYILFARSKTGEAEKTLKELLRAKESMSRYGFTETELDRAKRGLLAYITQLYSERDRQESSSYIGEFTNHFLKGASVPDIAWELEAVQQLLPGISVKETAGAAKSYFSTEDNMIFVLAPEGEPNLPCETRIRELEKEARKAKIPPPREEAVTDQLLDAQPLPGTIVSESADPETGAVLWELSNGGRVILKQTANRNNEIILYALARGGIASASPEEDMSARLAAEMLGASGVGSYSLQELQKKLTGKQVAVSYWTSSYIRGFQGSSTKEDLKTFFELTYLSFTQPRMDDSAVAALLDQYKTVLAQRKENPEMYFSQEIQRVMYGKDPRFAPMEVEDLKKVHPDQAMAFIRKGLNPGDYTFVFTGNIDLPDFREYVEVYLASIPPKERWDTWTVPPITRPGKTEKNLYKGKEEKSIVYIGRFIPSDYSEEDFAAASALEEYVDIRLTEEIREKLGGVYSVSARISLAPFPPEGELGMVVTFGCDPKRAEELAGAVEQQIRRIVSEPVDQDVFAKSVSALKKSWETSLQNNSYIAQSFANSAVIYRLPLNRLNTRYAQYDRVTPEAMQAICRRLLAQEPVRMTLYPEGWIR